MKKTEKEMAGKPRVVVIATPTHDGKVSAGYAFSLAETRLALDRMGIEVYPLLLEGALVESVRNELIAMFRDSNADDLVFIDSDIDWRAEDFVKLLNHPVKAVGATYRHKSDDTLSFVARTEGGKVPKANKDGLMPVLGLGCGFLRLTREAVEILWKKSKRYKVRGADVKQICDVRIVNGELVSEDISLCLKLPPKTVFLDPSIVLGHTGQKRFVGDPVKWFEAADAALKGK